MQFEVIMDYVWYTEPNLKSLAEIWLRQPQMEPSLLGCCSVASTENFTERTGGLLWSIALHPRQFCSAREMLSHMVRSHSTLTRQQWEGGGTLPQAALLNSGGGLSGRSPVGRQGLDCPLQGPLSTCCLFTLSDPGTVHGLSSLSSRAC